MERTMTTRLSMMVWPSAGIGYKKNGKSGREERKREGKRRREERERERALSESWGFRQFKRRPGSKVMATPPDSPGPEEAFFEFENTRARQQTTRPVPIEELLRQTKFSRQEIRVMYRGFKQVRTLLTYRPTVIDFPRDFHLNRKKLRVRNYAKGKNVPCERACAVILCILHAVSPNSSSRLFVTNGRTLSQVTSLIAVLVNVLFLVNVRCNVFSLVWDYHWICFETFLCCLHNFVFLICESVGNPVGRVLLIRRFWDGRNIEDSETI